MIIITSIRIKIYCMFPSYHRKDSALNYVDTIYFVVIYALALATSITHMVKYKYSSPGR